MVNHFDSNLIFLLLFKMMPLEQHLNILNVFFVVVGLLVGLLHWIKARCPESHDQKRLCVS